MQIFKVTDVQEFRRAKGEVVVTCPACGMIQTVIVYVEPCKITKPCFGCQYNMGIQIKE